MNGKSEQTSESGNGYHDKPKLTIAQQIAHLEAKGVTFDRYSKERAAACLSDECDFYELTSYRKLFAKRQGGKRNGEYANLDFAQLVIFAELDEMLREVLFVMTRHIEHSCKVDLKRNISERNDEDGYAIDAMKLDAVNIIDRASVPDNPSGPNRVMYTAVALLAGLFVAIAIIVLQDMLDTTVKSGDDAEELLGIPVLGRMPKPKKAR